jgi:hypothetical protein
MNRLEEKRQAMIASLNFFNRFLDDHGRGYTAEERKKVAECFNQTEQYIRYKFTKRTIIGEHTFPTYIAYVSQKVCPINSMIDTIVLLLSSDMYQITSPEKFTPSARWTSHKAQWGGLQSKQNPSKKDLMGGATSQDLRYHIDEM